MDKIIKPAKRLYGEVKLPGDKSISHRAIMVGAIARGTTRAKGVLDCDDCNRTIDAFRKMGIAIDKKAGLTSIEGRGLKGLTRPQGPIDLGDSGTSMRLLAGILAGQDFETTLTGDASLSARPMRRIVEPLSRMGVGIKARDGEYPPIHIKGGDVKAIRYKMPVSSAQIKSAILFAGLYADGVTEVEEPFKSRDHTERMLKLFGARARVRNSKISLKGRTELSAKDVEIPGDISSASFFMAAATILEGSKIMIKDVSINPTRAGILGLLKTMGARLKVVRRKRTFEPTGDILVESSKTKGIVIDEEMIPSIIDELPIIFVVASLSKGRTIIRGAQELRVKETDRIVSMKENLSALGAKIWIEGDDIVIDGVDELHGAGLESFNDHRTCMAAVTASLRAKGESTIDDAECVSKSFPRFFIELEKLKK